MYLDAAHWRWHNQGMSKKRAENDIRNMAAREGVDPKDLARELLDEGLGKGGADQMTHANATGDSNSTRNLNDWYQACTQVAGHNPSTCPNCK